MRMTVQLIILLALCSTGIAVAEVVAEPHIEIEVVEARVAALRRSITTSVFRT